MSHYTEFISNLYGRPATIKTYRCLFNKWLKPELKRLETPPLDGVILEYDIINMIKKWEKKTLSPRTIKTLLIVLSKYIAWTYGGVLDTRKYMQLVNRSKQKTEVKALTRKQARVALEQLKKINEESYLVAVIAYYTGMRKGEVFGLTWKDIDFVKGKIYIQRSYNGPTKNGQSRYVRISEELEKILLDRISLKRDNYLETSVIPKKFDPNPDIKRACKEIKVPIITTHGFRHTFATLALDAGRSIKQVQEALGHSSPSITMDIYWSNIKGDMELGFC